MSIDDLLPKVLSEDGEKSTYNPQKIYLSLRKETDLNESKCKEITDEVSTFLIKFSIKLITPPLIREIVNTFILREGIEKERLKYTRIGIPYYDLDKIFKQNKDDEDLKALLFNRIKKEYNEVSQLIEKWDKNNK